MTTGRPPARFGGALCFISATGNYDDASRNEDDDTDDDDHKGAAGASD